MKKAKTDFDFNGKKVETENVIPTQISDLTDGQQTLNAISQNAQDIDNIENTLPNLASISYVDQKFNGAAKAISFDSYATMITAFNALADDVYVSGQNINILTLEVPDLWVYEVDSTSIPYTYVDDATFTNELETNGYVQVGFYKLAALETQKVDLTDYQEKLTPTNVPSGTLTESIGFNANNELVRGSAGGGSQLYRHDIQCVATSANGTIYMTLYLKSSEILNSYDKLYAVAPIFPIANGFVRVTENNVNKTYPICGCSMGNSQMRFDYIDSNNSYASSWKTIQTYSDKVTPL